MAEQDFLDNYDLEDGEWEEGVVYVDEDGNEFMIEFVDADEDDEDNAKDGEDAEVDAEDEGQSDRTDDDFVDDEDSAQDEDLLQDDSEDDEDDNPFAYNAVQSATDAANEIYRSSAGTARDLAEAGREMKGALDDIKGMFNFKDIFKP